MALITIPAVAASSMNLQLIRGDNALEFFGGGSVIVQSTKAIWLLDFPIRTQRLVDTRVWWAALVQLSKLANTFEVEAPGWVQGSGYGGNNPTVSGGSQLGLSLSCGGAGGGQLICAAGDPIEVNGEYKVCTQDANSSGGGAVTFNFEPALRQSPPGGATVEVKNPKITCRLTTPAAGVSGRVPDFFNITISAIEHFGPA